jgi:hypothetical protein
METKTRGQRNNGQAASNVATISASLLAEFGKTSMVPGSMALAAITGLVGYGISKPLYDLVDLIGIPSRLVNDLNSAFNSHAEAVAGLKEGEAGISYSSQFDAFSLAVKNGEGIFYFSLLHDKDGNPQTAGVLILCETRVNRDFFLEIDGVKKLILPAGKTIFKAVPQSYAEKMPRAAKA